jgi:apolipoprotein D and lipocalin family protein
MGNNSFSQPMKTVPHVDLKRYAGKWYEIASFPQRFQKGCANTTAEYSLSDEGFVIVMNRCMKNGKESKIKGKAFVEKGSNNAKLKVQFFWPFRGKYWIIDLADDYSYAVVSHPNRKYLWILSRTPKMDPQVYKGILERCRQQGLDVSKLNMTVQ